MYTKLQPNYVCDKLPLFKFQNESPSGGQLNVLGTYILVSLFFVIGTMLEMAVVLAYKRIMDNRISDRKVDELKKTKSKQCGQNDEDTPKLRPSTNQIDVAALFLFFIFYLVFNGVYWMNNL